MRQLVRLVVPVAELGIVAVPNIERRPVAVEFVGGDVLPPNANPAVCVPAPAKALLVVPKLPPAVQTEPSYSSVRFLNNCGGYVAPPNPKPVV